MVGVTADPDYQSASPRYFNHNRFDALEDAWNWFVPVLSKDLLGKTEHFFGNMQIFGEEGFKETLSLDCFIKADPK